MFITLIVTYMIYENMFIDLEKEVQNAHNIVCIICLILIIASICLKVV